MIGEAEKITIAGLTFEKAYGARIIKSVIILNAKDGDCIEVPISKDFEIDKEKLTEEILEYYRKEVIAIIDIKFDVQRSNSRKIDLGFVGIKNKKHF